MIKKIRMKITITGIDNATKAIRKLIDELDTVAIVDKVVKEEIKKLRERQLVRNPKRPDATADK